MSQHLAVPLGVGHQAGHARPPRGDDVETRGAAATEHAGEAAAVEGDGVEHLAALGDPDAALVRHVGVPGGAVGVEADAVGIAVAEVGPDPPIGEGAVLADVKPTSSWR